MATEMNASKPSEKKVSVKVRGVGGGGGDTVYGLGLIGACMYYMGGAKTNKERVKGFLKALVWPVFVVHDLLTFLNKEKDNTETPEDLPEM